MNSQIGATITIIAYVIFSGVVISGVAKAFGPSSIAMYVAVIGLAIGLVILATHKGVNDSLEKLDK